jgi:hypothetical protein
MPNDGYVMIDVFSQYSNYNFLSLLSSVGGPIAYIDLGYEEILFQSLHEGDYYLEISNSFGEDCQSYEMAVSRPLLISAAAKNLSTGNVAGIPFRSEDILAYSRLNTGEERWRMFFDGSDVGVKTLANVATDTGDRILITTGGNQSLPGVGTVTPRDIVVFDATEYGSNTSGTFAMGLKGSQHQLTTSGEKLDAIDGWVFGELEGDYAPCYGFPVSTVGAAVVKTWGNATLRASDGDVFCKVYDEAAGGFRPWDDFLKMELYPGFDMTAIAWDDAMSRLYAVSTPKGTIIDPYEWYEDGQHWTDTQSIPVTPKDIWYFEIFDPWGYEIDTTDYEIAWHGPDHGWNYNIDAIEWNGW